MNDRIDVETADQVPSLDELVAMSMGERVAYFVSRAWADSGREVTSDPALIARVQARSVDTIAMREASLGHP